MYTQPLRSDICHPKLQYTNIHNIYLLNRKLLANRIVSYLNDMYEDICFQEELHVIYENMPKDGYEKQTRFENIADQIIDAVCVGAHIVLKRERFIRQLGNENTTYEYSNNVQDAYCSALAKYINKNNNHLWYLPCTIATSQIQYTKHNEAHSMMEVIIAYDDWWCPLLTVDHRGIFTVYMPNCTWMNYEPKNRNTEWQYTQHRMNAAASLDKYADILAAESKDHPFRFTPWDI